MNVEQLQNPVTEIEISELLNEEWNSNGKDVIRRMAFQLRQKEDLALSAMKEARIDLSVDDYTPPKLKAFLDSVNRK